MSELGVEAMYRQVQAMVAAAGALTAPHPSAATPSPAVATILWRPRAGTGEGAEEIEIFLVRRSPKLAFMAGTWTFPGGRVEAGDHERAAQAGVTVEIVAASRELAEETGVALPYDLATIDGGRWITPAISPIRFDARYLVARLPEGATPDAARSGGELDAGAWMTPRDALQRWERGELLVPSPVRRALAALATGLGGAAERLARAADAENHGPRLWDLARGVALCPVRTPTLPPATHTNCYVVGCGDVVVIDPASPFAEERAALDEALDGLAAEGRRVRAIWLTHHHGDHVGGAAHLADRLGVPIAAHPATAARLRGRVDVTQALEDGATIELDGGGRGPARRLRAVFTPGHAPGHLCFAEEATGFLVAGDMVAGIGTILVEPTEGDMRLYLDSLAYMKRLAPRALLPAHGGAIGDAATKLDEYTAHRLWREAQVLAAVRALGPAPPHELVAHAYSDTAKAIHGLAARSLIAHLVKLAEEGLVRKIAPDGALEDAWEAAGEAASPSEML